MNKTKKKYTDIKRYYDGVPDYMIKVYDWAYVNPYKVALLDRNIVVTVLLFLNDQRLMRSYLNEISEGMRVWQVAHVYGNLVQRVAEKVGKKGVFHLTDITPVQIEHAEQKLKKYPQTKVFRADTGNFLSQSETGYDVVSCFMLLHEVPEEEKYKIVNDMLANLTKHGKAIFVDYHKPKWWQPVRYILTVVNAWLEPFANAIWKNDISHYATEKDQFNWTKKTFFGGVYQSVVVTHKENVAQKKA